MASLRVAVLMPSLNEEKSVDSTLSSLFANARQPDEVIVADGGSTDATLDKIAAWQARGHNIKVIDNPLVFPGAGRNEAFKQTDADVLIALDFGNQCDPDYVEKMVAPFEADESLDVVAGTFTTVVETSLQKAVAIIGYTDNYLIQRFSVEERLAMAPDGSNHTPGMSVAWHRRVWERTGGQPDWLRAAEDLLFGRRLNADGATIALQVTSQIHHHMRSSLRQFFSMNRHYSRGRSRTGLATRKSNTDVGAVVVMLFMAVAGLVWPQTILWSWSIAFVAFAILVLQNVVRPLVRVEGFLPRPDVAIQCFVVAWAGLFGTVVGTLQGTYEWWTQPMWRRKLRAYLGHRASAGESA